MLDTLTGWMRRVARGLRVAVIIPVGPGHEALYTECRASVERAWRRGRGPFVTMSLIAVDDTGGQLGRSQARNIGIERGVGVDPWNFPSCHHTSIAHTADHRHG